MISCYKTEKEKYQQIVKLLYRTKKRNIVNKSLNKKK